MLTIQIKHFACLLLFFASSLVSQAQVNNAALKEIAGVVSDSFGTPVATVEAFMNEALKLEQTDGVPATVFIGLAILESAGFSSYLYQKAKNPFGMKATAIWKGEKFMMWHEGKMTAFRQYETPGEAVRDFASFLRSRKWFADALKCPSGDAECFLEGLSAKQGKKSWQYEPGYARDPEWANKIRRVIAKYKLQNLKK
ncbi:MAG: glucosaminidase domain-containing protein [Bacteroidetes bacterium]|nr:glucosaminidase domain-containing protein [Bacteroidota bacterium]